MKPEPAVRTDGKCATCRGTRAGRIPKTLSKAGQQRLRAMLAADPFCAATCARTWHGVAIVDLQPWKAHDMGKIGHDANWQAA